MSRQKRGAIRLEKAVELLERYKMVFLVILVGGVLLLWPEEKRAVPTEMTVQAEEVTSFDLERMERKMGVALSRIEGTGEVTVLLTVKNSSRNILAADKTASEQGSSTEKKVETVVISTGSGSQSPVLLEQVYPEFQGALVVCDGGDDTAVRLKLVEAVSALTGLGADKICICRGK